MSSNRFFSSTTSRFSRSSSSNQDDTLLAPVLDRGGRVPDDVDARLAELALRAKAGDANARNLLFLAIRPRCAPVLNGVRRHELWRSLEGRSWTFNDLEQESFLIFCDLLDHWNGAEPRFAGYFFSRYRWRVFDTLRRWTVTPLRAGAFEEAFAVAQNETDAIELRVALSALLAELDESELRLLEWRAIDGRTDAEMARALGVSLKTVRRRRVQAFARARALLIQLEPEAGFSSEN